MIGTVLQADLEEIIKSKNWDDLRAALSEFEPADIAEIIIDLPPEDEGVIFRVLPRERAAAVFSYLPLEQQEQLLKSLSNEQMRGILDSMTPDDRTRLLEELPAEVTRKMLESLSPEELKSARELLGYPPETAGRYMTPEYVALDRDLTAEQAIAQIRRTGRGKETLNVIYVLDKDGTLMHDVRLGTIVLADPQLKLGDIPERNLVSLPATAGRAEVLEAFEKYDRIALPVTDAQGRMLGIITVDDVLDVAEAEATEDIQKMGGTEALDAPYLSVGFWDMVRKRGVWLAVLFVGEMLTATAMGYFESEIEKAAIVALFVPLIISSGGNSGSQGTSLIIRSLALKEIELRDWWRVFLRELRTGLALGVLLAIVGFARIGAWQYMSSVPGVGSFFQTHGQTLPEGSAPGSVMFSQDKALAQPLTLPAGAVLAKGTVIPPSVELPATLSERAHEPSAYGPHWLMLGLTVSIALVGVVTWGALSGSMLPFILRRFGLDPATSSAPFVATLVDVTGLVIYFTVAMLLLRGTLL